MTTNKELSEAVHLCYSLLKKVISISQTNESSATVDRSTQIAPHISLDFDKVDFCNKIDGVTDIESIVETYDRIQFVFHDGDAYPHRAVFQKDCEGNWKLHSLKFQCPVCFGTGVNDANECSICNGKGWGA